MTKQSVKPLPPTIDAKTAALRAKRLAATPVELHHHTLTLARMPSGEIRRVKDQYRVDRVVKPAVSQSRSRLSRPRSTNAAT